MDDSVGYLRRKTKKMQKKTINSLPAVQRGPCVRRVGLVERAEGSNKEYIFKIFILTNLKIYF